MKEDNINVNASFSGGIELSDLIENIKHVPLYLSKDVEYLNSIDKIRIHGESIYILQEKGLSIYLYKFNLDGKLIAYFDGSTGKFKLYSASDFVVNDSGLYLTDTYTMSLYLFDHSFNFIKKQSLDLNTGFKNIMFQDDYLLARVDASEDVIDLSSLVYKYDIDKELSTPIEELSYLVGAPGLGTNLMYSENFHYTDVKNKILYTDLMNPDFHIFNNGEISSKINVAFTGDVWVGDTERDKIKSLTKEETGMVLLESKKSFVIDHAYMKGHILIFTFTTVGKRYYALVDVRTEECSYFKYDLFNPRLNGVDGLVPLKNLSGIDEDGNMIFSMDYELYKYYLGHSNNPASEEFFANPDDEYICSHVLSIASTNKMEGIVE
jgi:hypothetical protein